MQPPMISHSVHNYETAIPTTQSSWMEVTANHSTVPFLLPATSRKNNLAEGYLFLLLILISIAGYLAKTRLSQQPQQTAPAIPRNSSTNTAQNSSTNHPLHPRLIQLLNGDESAAHRLLRHSYINHPTRSQQWHYEHVIEDIIRDRR